MLVYAKRQAPSIRVFESPVSQPAPAVGQFKSARQEAAFGPEQASDSLLASAGFMPSGHPLWPPFGFMPAGPRLFSYSSASAGASSLASDRLYAVGAKALQLELRPTPPSSIPC